MNIRSRECSEYKLSTDSLELARAKLATSA